MAMIEIRNSSDITVSGLSITGYRTKALSAMPIGILVTGSGHAIRQESLPWESGLALRCSRHYPFSAAARDPSARCRAYIPLPGPRPVGARTSRIKRTSIKRDWGLGD